jgi:iron complex transport system permease protein
MQGLFRNALADPGLIGVSSGAALAAVAVIVIGQNRFGPDIIRLLPAAAFLGGLIVTALLYLIATRSGRTSVALLLLSGIALGAISMAGTGLLIFMSSEQQLRELTFWSMGSLAGATWVKTASVALSLLIAAPMLLGLSRRLDRLALGEADARYMGVNVQRTKLAAIVTTALLTGAAVSVSGTIGFVGLVVPHMLRLTIGPSHRLLLPLSLLLGGSLMILADLLARTVVTPAELPIGIVTACLGGPMFLWMLLRHAKQNFA